MEYKKLTDDALADFLQRACVQLAPELTQQLLSLGMELVEYRTKIEQDKLVALDDSLIGESIYGIHQDVEGNYWLDGDENTLLGFTSNGVVTWNDVHGYNDWFMNGFWFHTSEEAEKIFKELQE